MIGQSCEIGSKGIPMIENKDGKLVESKLYKDMQKVIKDISLDNLYNLFKSEEFKQELMYEDLEKDENGEPTIESLYQCGLAKYVSKTKVSQSLFKKYKVKPSIEIDRKSISDAVANVINMNDELSKSTDGSQYYRVAIVRAKDKNESVLKYVVYEINGSSSLWNYNLREFSEDLQNLDDLVHDNVIDTTLSDEIIWKCISQFPDNTTEIATFNPHFITDYLVQTKNDINAKREPSINIRKIDAASELNKRAFGIVNDFTKEVVQGFCEQEGIEFSEDEYNNNRNKYTNLILDTIVAKTIAGNVSYEFLKDKSKEEYLRNHINKLTNELKSRWNKIQPPNYENKLISKDNLLEKPKEEEYLINISDVIKKMGSRYDVTNSTKKAALTLIETIINYEQQQLAIFQKTNISTNPEYLQERWKLLNKIKEMYEENNFETAMFIYYNNLQYKIKNYKEQISQPTIDDSQRAQILREIDLELQMYNQISTVLEKNIESLFFDKNEIVSNLEELIVTAEREYAKNKTLKLRREAKRAALNSKKKKVSKPRVLPKSLVELAKMYDKDNKEFEEERGIVMAELIQAYKDAINLSQKSGYEELNGAFSVAYKQLRLKVDLEQKKLTTSFLKEYEVEAAQKIPFGDNKGKIVNIEDKLSRADRDMWGVERLLDAMRDAPDRILKLTDKIVKQHKNIARLKAIDFVNQLKKEAKMLENAGITDTKWMYEREYFDREYKTGMYVRKGSKEYAEIMKNPAKARFYNFFMKNKAKFDNMYPPYTVKEGQIINIRKDVLERLKDSGSLQGAAKSFKESIKDEWMNRTQEDEDNMAGFKTAFTNMDGEEIKILPIYYNNINFDALDTLDDVSEDAVSTLAAYAAKAIEYSELNKIINQIELTRNVLKQREIPVEDNGFKIVSWFKKKMQRESEISDELSSDKVATQTTYIDNGKSNLYKRFDGYLDMAVYGRFYQDDKQIGKISLIKAVDKINGWTARASMSLSLLNGISNIATGYTMMNIETLAKRYFKPKDLAWADATYAANLVPLLGNLGNRIKDDKLSLFGELFDVSQDYDKEGFSNIEWDKKTKLSRLKLGKTLMFIQDAGEHNMSFRTALAMANTVKLKDNQGEIHNLWDSLEVEYIQEDGSFGKDNKNLGARLKIKDGYTKEDGSKFTNNDIIRLQSKIASINQGMHGIYNKIDANLIQRYAIGRAAYLFRKWIWKSYSKRFNRLDFNYDSEEWEEGYYRSCARFIKNVASDLKEFKLNIGVHWDSLSPEEKSNCKKVLIEMASLLAITLINLMADWKGDGDDDDDSWAKNMLMYQSIRLQSELGALTPVSMVGESIRLFKSPLPMVNTLTNILDTYKALWIPNWFEDVDRGKFKGHSLGFKYLFGNKVLNPLYNTMYGNLNAEESIGNFLQ